MTNTLVLEESRCIDRWRCLQVVNNRYDRQSCFDKWFDSKWIYDITSPNRKYTPFSLEDFIAHVLGQSSPLHVLPIILFPFDLDQRILHPWIGVLKATAYWPRGYQPPWNLWIMLSKMFAIRMTLATVRVPFAQDPIHPEMIKGFAGMSVWITASSDDQIRAWWWYCWYDFHILGSFIDYLFCHVCFC